VGALLPTPLTTDGGSNSPGDNARNTPGLLLPTLRTENNENRQSERFGGVYPTRPGNFHLIIQQQMWGDYAPAIARWEATTRPAPPPTLPTGREGAQRLNPAFAEWMMGLPAGHITAVPGITRNEALKAAGNGVVPQQAAEALRRLL
jgi:DNA (cytosine-5)-methyltransferase 1